MSPAKTHITGIRAVSIPVENRCLITLCTGMDGLNRERPWRWRR